MILCGQLIRNMFHKSRKVNDSVTLHVLYKPTNATPAEWEKILDDAQQALPFIEKKIRCISIRQYTFIHGGDGGMEYPMATLLIGPGAWLHEWLHNWYHGLLGNNESLYGWMDEGFTTYAEDLVTAFLKTVLLFHLMELTGDIILLQRAEKKSP